jgi:hypothetical protein
MEVTTPVTNVREAHQILAEMAWDRLPEGCGLESHLMAMINILSEPELYTELWRRIWDRQSARSREIEVKM